MFAEHFGFELIFLAAVALVVVGPKDLPILMRKVGQFTGRMRGLAAEFRASFEELARQSELDELRKEVEALRQGQLGMAEHQTEIEREFDQLHHAMNPEPGERGYTPPPISVGYAADALEDDQPDLPFGSGEAAKGAVGADVEPEQPALFEPLHAETASAPAITAPHLERMPESVRA